MKISDLQNNNNVVLRRRKIQIALADNNSGLSVQIAKFAHKRIELSV